MSHVKETKLYKVLEGRGQDELLQKIDSIASWINLMYPQINRVFYNYTVHGMPHSINVMEYMYELIDDIDKMNDLDIVLCIYSALLHDIGMIVFDDEIEKIKSNKDNLEVNYNTLYLEYKNENLAIQECIRSVHGIRVEKVLKRSFNDIKCFFHMPNTTISFFY